MINKTQFDNKIKYCRICSTELILEENWYKCNVNSHNYICIPCELKKCNDYSKKHKKERQEQGFKNHKINMEVMHSLKINGCAICGYNECGAALEFHHVNSEDKKFNLCSTALGRREKSIVEELNKCILLCANCHRKIHTKERDDKK